MRSLGCRQVTFRGEFSSLVGCNAYHDIQICKFYVNNCFQRRLTLSTEPSKRVLATHFLPNKGTILFQTLKMKNLISLSESSNNIISAAIPASWNENRPLTPAHVPHLPCRFFILIYSVAASSFRQLFCKRWKTPQEETEENKVTSPRCCCRRLATPLV